MTKPAIVFSEENMKRKLSIKNNKFPDHKVVSTDSLIPYAMNSRTHSEHQIAQIAASIKEFGFLNPVIVDGESGIIAGHGRVMAAQKLGLKELPVIEAEHLTEMQKKAYVIADNRLALNAGWDVESLTNELLTLKDDNFDIDLLGFDVDELSKLLEPDQVDGLTDEDAVPDIPDDPVTKLGDIWILGNHRLMCGDSTSIDAVEKLMDGEKASLIVTDPPWNVDYGAALTPKYQQNRKILNDSMGREEWRDFLTGAVSCMCASTLPGCPIYCVMGSSEWPEVDAALRAGGFHWSSTIIWAKDTLVLSRKDYHTQYEPLWYGWNESGPRIWIVHDRKQSDLWQCKRPKVSKLHPTTKPVELLERAVMNSSNHGTAVLDPFGGSGSLMIACEKNHRHCYMMELDPKYCDVIIKRWQEYTGKEAVLESSNQKFMEFSNAKKR